MSNTLVNAYIYENLKQIYVFNKKTKLCVYEPTGKLFIIKNVDFSCKASYEALQSLNNSHLAKIYCIIEKSDSLEVVREYISGDTLVDLLKGNQCLPLDIAIKITADICDGLLDMHSLGLVHRDINPNNIIVSSDGCAKIIDFGIARCFNQEKNTDTTILGTPGYAAPEQFGFSQSDSKTDIYAVGVLLNVMVTGKLPNEHRITGTIGKIVKRCIEIDSHKRYKNIYDLKKAIYDRMSGSSRMERVLKQIPGIRSHNIIVVILAVIGYICEIIFTIAAFATAESGTYFQMGVAWILCFVVPFFCFHNLLGIWDKLPFSNGATKRNQRIVYNVLGIVSIFFGLIIFGLTNAH